MYKSRVEVIVYLKNKTTLKGHFFTAQDERVLDVLNDERTFIPFEELDGTINLLSKSVVANVRPLDNKQKRADF